MTYYCRLVELMGRKYFENLMNKYTERKKEDGLCPSDNLPLGITVNSLSMYFADMIYLKFFLIHV